MSEGGHDVSNLSEVRRLQAAPLTRPGQLSPEQTECMRLGAAGGTLGGHGRRLSGDRGRSHTERKGLRWAQRATDGSGLIVQRGEGLEEQVS